MSRPFVLAALLGTPVALASCAQILSYDDYQARPASRPDTGTDTAVADVADAADTGPAPARLPTRPAGEAKPSGTGRTLWFGVKRMYLGSQTSLGVDSADAWKEWGYDLDKICTSEADSVRNVGTCRRHPEAQQDWLADGNGCRDNNWGRHVIALIKLSSEGFEKRVNDGLLEGSNTWLLRLDDVDDTADDPYTPGKFYRASEAAKGAVRWDGSDVREIVSDTVIDGSIEKPRADFPKGYIRNHLWVSGDPELRSLLLPVSSSLYVPLKLDSTIITLELNPDHKSARRAVLAGALPVSSIDDLLRPIASGAGFCPGTPLYQSLYRSVVRFPDVVIGAPNLQDTTLECDGISLGLGLDVGTIQPVTKVVAPPATPPDPCGDAGTSGG
ncbi:MAG: hypothetical protein HYV09_26000 [Deltaproteobacteria bacterium]|nr:hypothetical protein [Deltaproteobacteria bacterium]